MLDDLDMRMFIETKIDEWLSGVCGAGCGRKDSCRQHDGPGTAVRADVDLNQDTSQNQNANEGGERILNDLEKKSFDAAKRTVEKLMVENQKIRNQIAALQQRSDVVMVDDKLSEAIRTLSGKVKSVTIEFR